MNNQIKLDESWKQLLADEFDKPYFKQLKQFLLDEKAQGYTIYPPGSQIFAALNHTPVNRIKAVILGQDPYHGPGQAHGLCFSVNDGIPIPPSLQNIFKELKTDLGCSIPASGNLSKWADQGVLLLNATLTVRAGQAGSHQNKGWETFTDKMIETLSHTQTHLVFMLWGKYAQSKQTLIDGSRHLVLTAAHPSPLARGAFFGCKHFSACNAYLQANHLTPVNWQL